MDIVSKATRQVPIQAQTSAVTTKSFRGSKAHPTISGVKIADHVENNPKVKQTVMQNASSTVGADTLNGGIVDFRVEKGILDLVTDAFLKVSITNDTGASATIAPSPFLIQRIDVFANNGANLLTTIYGQEIWLSLIAYNQQRFEQIVSLLGTDVSYVRTGTAVADTASRDFHIPLIPLFSQANLHLAALKGELQLKVYFNVTALTHLAGSLVNCDNVQLLLKGFKETPKTKEMRMNLYAGKYIVPTVFFQRMSQTMALAASNTYSIVLTGIKGMSAGLFITVRAAAITGANQGTYLAEMDYYDIQNADGSSLLGFYKKRTAERLLDYVDISNNRFGNNSNFLLIPFSESPVQDFITGSNNGHEVFTGFEKFVWTTPGTTSSASYVIDIYSLTHESLNIVNNNIASTSSN